MKKHKLKKFKIKTNRYCDTKALYYFGRKGGQHRAMKFEEFVKYLEYPQKKQ